MTVHTLDLDFLGLPHVIASYLLISGERRILVDPGPSSCLERLDEQLSGIGTPPESITDVLLTHIHFDHAGAAWAYAERGATVHVHPLGERHLHDPTRLWESAARIYGTENMTMLWGEMKPIARERLRTWDHHEVDTFGAFQVEAYHTPGHAKHHIAWRVDSSLFLGDVGGIQINDGPVEAPCPPPDIDVVAWTQSLNLLSDVAGIKRAFRTHFGEIPADSLQRQLDLTRQALGRWLEIAREVLQMEQELQSDAFIARVQAERQAFPNSADAYALANPAHMSLGGLARYLAQAGA